MLKVEGSDRKEVSKWTEVIKTDNSCKGKHRRCQELLRSKIGQICTHLRKSRKSVSSDPPRSDVPLNATTEAEH